MFSIEIQKKCVVIHSEEGGGLPCNDGNLTGADNNVRGRRGCNASRFMKCSKADPYFFNTFKDLYIIKLLLLILAKYD
jgi:hypothetical protein